MYSQKTDCKSRYSFILGPITLVLQSLYLGSELDVIISAVVVASILLCIMYVFNYYKPSSYALYLSSIIIFGIFSYYTLVSVDVTIPIIAIISVQTVVSMRLFFASFFIGFISSIILFIYDGRVLELLDWRAFIYMVLINAVYRVVYQLCCLLIFPEDSNIEVLVHDIKSVLSANYNYLSTVKELFLSGEITRSKGSLSIDYKKDCYTDLLRFSNLTVDVSLKAKNVLRFSRSQLKYR